MGHRLISGAAPNCRVPHGHDEVVTVDIARNTTESLDPETNMLVEFEQAKGRWFGWIDNSVDHTFHISDADPLIDFFRDNEPDLLARLLVTPGDPTTELRAACYYAKLRAFLNESDQQLVCTRVVIQETPTNAVEFNATPTGSILPDGDAHWWHRADSSINDLAA